MIQVYLVIWHRAYLASHNFLDQFVDETDFIVAARKAGVKYIVKLSTFEGWMNVYAGPFYARAHLAVEYFLEHGDIPFTSLRANLFHNYVGVDWDSVPNTKQFKTLLGEASVATIDPADVGKAAAALLLLEDPSPHFGKKYMLTGPEDVNNRSIEAALSEVLQREVEFEGSLTKEEIRQWLKYANYPEKVLDGMLSGIEDFRQGKGDRAHTRTSPEIEALAPPTSTLKEYLRKYYHAKN